MSDFVETSNYFIIWYKNTNQKTGIGSDTNQSAAEHDGYCAAGLIRNVVRFTRPICDEQLCFVHYGRLAEAERGYWCVI